MENMRKELDNLKTKFTGLEEKKEAFLRSFGNFLLEDKQKQQTEGLAGLSEAYDEISTLIINKSGIDSQIKEITSLLEQKKVLEDERKEARDAYRDLEKANLTLYENMGRAGFLAFQEGIITGESFDAIFAALSEGKEKINTFEVELKKSGAEEGGLIKKFMTRSREVYLKSNQNVRLRNLTKVYQKAGEALGEVDGIPWEENDSLKHAFLPFYKNKEKQTGLLDLDESLSQKEQDLGTQMEGLGVRRNSRKRIQELQDELEVYNEQYENAVVALGDIWWTLDEKERAILTLPEDLKAIKSELDEEGDALSEAREVLERKIQRKELTESLSLLEKERQKLENRIQQLNGDLDRKKSEINTLNQKIASLSDDLSK